MSQSTRFLGIDGCPGAWFCIWQGSGGFGWDIYESVRAIWDQHQSAERILIDIPIGLTNDQPRSIEPIVRRQLGERRSSVFPVPCRDAVYAVDYPEACAVNFQRWGKKLSKQSWLICDKIREMDRFLHRNPQARVVIGESHPELAFSYFNNGPMAENKKTEQGLQARAKLIEALAPDLYGKFDDIRMQFLRKQLATDDIHDAMILMLAARTAVPLDAPTEQGIGGIHIQMYVPQV